MCRFASHSIYAGSGRPGVTPPLNLSFHPRLFRFVRGRRAQRALPASFGPSTTPPVASVDASTSPASSEGPLEVRRVNDAQLLAFAESRARELGAREVAVDTAEGAHHLIRYYSTRGYREVGHAQWEHTNYRSVILSKSHHG